MPTTLSQIHRLKLGMPGENGGRGGEHSGIFIFLAWKVLPQVLAPGLGGHEQKE